MTPEAPAQRMKSNINMPREYIWSKLKAVTEAILMVKMIRCPMGCFGFLHKVNSVHFDIAVDSFLPFRRDLLLIYSVKTKQRLMIGKILDWLTVPVPVEIIVQVASHAWNCNVAE